MKAFRSFRLDPKNHCLWHGEQRVPLTPKAFDVLRYLVEHPQRLVTQDEILEALWPETYVNPELIKKYILGIRKVLGDRHDKPEFIETIPKRGYQFVAPVSDEIPARSSDSTTEATKKMVGRETPLTELRRLLSNARQGQRQVVFVTGDAGIGKTTLVDAFHQQVAQNHNLRIARGQCVEGFGGKEAYYPMLEALGQLARTEHDGLIVHALATRAPTWLIQFPSLVKAEQREALQREILGATRERMVREICEVLESLSSETPLVLILEDLHWADLSTLDLISALARRRQPAKLMIIATYRPADVIVFGSPLKGLKQDLAIHNLCSEVPLERLEEPEIAEFLANEFRGLPSALSRLIYRHSGGNALFMVAIVQDLRKKDVIKQQENGWTLGVPPDKLDITVPETLQGMLKAQLQQLSSTERRILESASVAGEHFSVWAITPALDMAPEGIEDACESLSERAQFIKSAGFEEFDSATASPSYDFRHSLYRQVVYGALSDVTRSRLHRTLGQRLCQLGTSGKPELASELALHFERGREYDRAVDYLILTSENTTRRFAYRDSILVVQHALSLVPKTSAVGRAQLEIKLLGRMGDAYYALGDMMESARAFKTAAVRAAEAGFKADEVNALCCLARTTVLMDGDQGIAACQKALTVCEGTNDQLLLARTQLLAATLRLGYDQWRTEDAETCASARHTIARLSDPRSPSYQEIWDTHRQSMQGESQQALMSANDGIVKYEAILDADRGNSSLVAYVLALSAKSIALMHLGKLGQALEVIRTARSRAERNGSNAWIFMLREAWLRTLAFDFEGARRLRDEMIGINPGYLSGHPSAIAAIAAGYGALYEEDHEGAMRSFGELLDRRPTPKFFLHWYWRMQAELGMSNALLATGDAPRSRREADRFLHSAQSTADPNLHALAWEMKARVAMAERKWTESETCLQEGLAVVEKFGVPLSAWKVHETAWKSCEQRQDSEAAEAHRARAEAGVFAIADSFSLDEPLRATFLKAIPIHHALFSGTHIGVRAISN